MPTELPDSYESIYTRALTQMAEGRGDEAIESMLRIVNRLGRLRPETLQRRTNLQQTLVAAWDASIRFLRWEKRYDQAIATTESVLDRLPSPESGRRRVASLMIEKGEVEEGLTRLRQIAETLNDFGSWIDLGAEHFALKRYGKAETSYQSALAMAESNEHAVIANSALLRVYQETDRVDQVLDVWNLALVLDPELAEQAVEVYGWLIRRGELDRARPFLERERNPITRTFYEGLLEWYAGQQEAARQRWREVLEMDPGQQNTQIETWMEAALRLDEPQRVDQLATELTRDGRL
jgi:tetratricopeptide (TPR) repeat protein